VGNGVSRADSNSGLELLKIIGDSCFLLAPRQVADRFNLKRESAFGKVGAEQKEYRSASHYGELSPDCQKPLMVAQQPAGTSVRAGPRYVAVQIDREAVA
jgi:hypothetical protein